MMNQDPMKTDKQIIYVALPKADKVYINKIGCLRYSLGNGDGPVEETIDIDWIMKLQNIKTEESSLLKHEATNTNRSDG